jgi:hypothetical protein
LETEFLDEDALKDLSIGAMLAAVVSSAALAQTGDMSGARAAAIHECNVLASPYALYTWGNWQLYIYRECMAKHGDIE